MCSRILLRAVEEVYLWMMEAGHVPHRVADGHKRVRIETHARGTSREPEWMMTTMMVMMIMRVSE